MSFVYLLLPKALHIQLQLINDGGKFYATFPIRKRVINPPFETALSPVILLTNSMLWKWYWTNSEARPKTSELFLYVLGIFFLRIQSPCILVVIQLQCKIERPYGQPISQLKWLLRSHSTQTFQLKATHKWFQLMSCITTTALWVWIELVIYRTVNKVINVLTLSRALSQRNKLKQQQIFDQHLMTRWKRKNHLVRTLNAMVLLDIWLPFV